MEYVPGVRNCTADCLSRLVSVQERERDDETHETPEEGMFQESVCVITKGAIEEEEWKHELKKDPILMKVSKNLVVGWDKGKVVEEGVKPYWDVREELSEADGCLFRGTKLIPPNSLCLKLMELAHEGHFGITKTKQRLRQDYWWPGMDVAIEREVRNCILCSSSDKVLRSHVPPMVCRRLPDGP